MDCLIGVTFFAFRVLVVDLDNKRGVGLVHSSRVRIILGGVSVVRDWFAGVGSIFISLCGGHLTDLLSVVFELSCFNHNLAGVELTGFSN